MVRRRRRRRFNVGRVLVLSSPPAWHMKPGMTRWKEEALKPNPFSPVQSARKFSVRMWRRGKVSTLSTWYPRVKS